MFMQTTANSIAGQIDDHIALHGGINAEWYIGIAADPNDRLVNGHNATTQRNDAMYWDASNDEIARAIEQHFLKKGCKGGPGGGGPGTRFVYVYKIDYLTTQ